MAELLTEFLGKHGGWTILFPVAEKMLIEGGRKPDLEPLSDVVVKVLRKN